MFILTHNSTLANYARIDKTRQSQFLVIRVIDVPVTRLHVVRVVVASAPYHAVGTAFDSVPVYNLFFSRLLPQ